MHHTKKAFEILKSVPLIGKNGVHNTKQNQSNCSSRWSQWLASPYTWILRQLPRRPIPAWKRLSRSCWYETPQRREVRRGLLERLYWLVRFGYSPVEHRHLMQLQSWIRRLYQQCSPFRSSPRHNAADRSCASPDGSVFRWYGHSSRIIGHHAVVQGREICKPDWSWRPSSDCK